MSAGVIQPADILSLVPNNRQTKDQTIAAGLYWERKWKLVEFFIQREY